MYFVKVTLDVEASNKAFINSTIPKNIVDITERIHPEASYFLKLDDCRTYIMVFDLKDPSDIPPIADTFCFEYE